jgi:hypothetical protein
MPRRLLLPILAAGACLLVTAGCFGGSPAAAKPSDVRIQLREYGNGSDLVLKTTRLSCTSPNTACDALRDYVTHYRKPTALCSGTVPATGALYATVSGTLDGRPLRAELAPGQMCFVAPRLIDDLYTATQLRTGPAPSDVTIKIWTHHNGHDRLAQTIRLTCTNSSPRCAALRAYAQHERDPVLSCSPTLPGDVSPTATVVGTLDGHPIDATFDPATACSTSKIARLELFSATRLRRFDG